MKSSIAPVRWTPPPAPPVRHPKTVDVEVVALPGQGPEDTLIDDDGSVLTGLLDGRILRVSADGKTITTSPTPAAGRSGSSGCPTARC